MLTPPKTRYLATERSRFVFAKDDPQAEEDVKALVAYLESREDTKMQSKGTPRLIPADTRGGNE